MKEIVMNKLMRVVKSTGAGWERTLDAAESMRVRLTLPSS